MIGAKLRESSSFFSEYTYYVDSVNGDNDNNGKTPSTAFASLSSVPTLTSGQSVALAKGSSWRDQLTLAGGNNTVTTYGSGSRPIIDCSDIIVNATFTKTGGQTNVYQVTVSPELLVNDKTWVNAWEDSAFLTRATSLANCDSTPGSYYPTSDTVAPITLYIHPTGSTNPISDGKTYEYTQRKSAIFGENIDGVTLNGVQTQKPLHNNGSIYLGRTATVDDCILYDGNKHSMYVQRGSQVTNCEGTRCYYGIAPYTTFVSYDDDPGGLNVLWEDCLAQEDVSGGDFGTGFINHRASTNFFGTVTYRRCTVINMNGGFDVRHTNTTVCEDCDVETCFRAIIIAETATDLTLTNFNFTHAGDIDTRPVALVDGGSLTADNLSITTKGVSGGLGMIDVSDDTVMEITNSTFQKNSFTGATRTVYRIPSGVTVNLTANNNEYLNQIRVINDLNTNSSLVLDSDFNTFSPSTTRNRINNVDYTTVAAYVSATGQDTNSTII